MSSIRAWAKPFNKLKMKSILLEAQLFSIGGRLTLLKSVLGSTPIYNMSLFKVPKAVLKSMESIRRNFFNGIRDGEKKIAWVSWSKVLASKSNGGLGVSSFYALNRGLIFKWIWRFLSRDQSLWAQVIHALHGSNTSTLSASYSSLWSSIIKECNALKSQGLDLISHCKIRVGNGMSTSFWHDQWLGDSCLRLSYPRLFALENNKVCSVAAKMSAPFVSSLRRDVRGGEESAQLSRISDLLDTVVTLGNGLGGTECTPIRSMSTPTLIVENEIQDVDEVQRWQRKMHLFLTSMSVVYVLSIPIPDDGDDITMEQIAKRRKCENDDYVCRDSLEAKYMAEDASNKKFFKDFKHTLKYKNEELTLVKLGSHMHIWESLEAHNNDKPTRNNVDGSSVANMVEHNNSTRYNDNKGKLNIKITPKLMIARSQS
ncbi:hypothetical protein Tco_0255761 [Tanacetum coccineum]